MIVLSILTGLALEQALEAVHRRHLTQEASETMRAELRQNIKDVADALEYNEEKRLVLEEARVKLLGGIRGKANASNMNCNWHWD